MINKITKALPTLLLFFWSDVYAQTFTRVITGDIATDEFNSQSASWGDYDNDGDLDLFVTNTARPEDPTQTSFIYRNDGGDSFERLDSFGNFSAERALGGSWGDYDNDGDLDLFVIREPTTLANQLFENNGDGSFTLVETGKIPFDLGFSESASWADYNNDGLLDLLVANFDEIDFLYRNDGNGSFFSVQIGDLVNETRASFTVSWGDYDNDGDVDVYMPNNDAGPPGFLWRNNGTDVFEKLEGLAVDLVGPNSIGSSWGDYDNDGDLDLYVITVGGDNLFQNNGDGSFTSTNDQDAYQTGFARGSSWADYDNDGDLDLFVASRTGNNALFENRGTLPLRRITTGEIVNDGSFSNGVAWGDYDTDGDLDLFVANASVDLNGEGAINFLYRNDGNDNNWINIKCIGTLSNTSAIGAKVRLKAMIRGRQVWQLREISGQTGNKSQNSLNAGFGLGDATIVDTVRIEWPSGQRQLLTAVPVNQFLEITEPAPPEAAITPITELVNAGVAIEIVASEARDELSAIDLLFRQGGDSRFSVVAMANLGNGVFQATVPSDDVTTRGVEYHFVAMDIAGNQGRVPRAGSFSVQVTDPAGISRGEEEPFGSDQTAYHLFSVPLDLEDKTPSAILEDDMGAYDESRWRFLEYVTEEQTYREFPEIEQLQPGKGYWFLVTEPARVIDTPGGTSFSTAEPLAVLVRSGWNLIGNPFNFNIPASNVRLGLSPIVLRSYSGSWNNPISDPVTEIRPFEGYAVSIDEFAAELFIDPNVPVVGLAKAGLQPSPKTSPPRTARAETSESARRDAVALGRKISWFINVQARCQQARDVDNVLGVAAQASESWDPLDFPEPPPMGEYVSIYFAHPEWSKRSQRFCTDFRPAFSQGGEWEFEVRTNIRDRVELTFAGIETVPQAFDIWLVDEPLGLTQNLRRNPHFSVAGVGEDHPKRLKLLVGHSEFVDDLLPAQEIPTDFELSQNFPNPFNPVTSIRFGLPREERVTLKIFNILGEEIVALLNDEPQSAGFHVAIWDGRDHSGRQVASGVYLYQLIGGDLKKTRKMGLVR